MPYWNALITQALDAVNFQASNPKIQDRSKSTRDIGNCLSYAILIDMLTIDKPFGELWELQYIKLEIFDLIMDLYDACPDVTSTVIWIRAVACYFRSQLDLPEIGFALKDSFGKANKLRAASNRKLLVLKVPNNDEDSDEASDEHSDADSDSESETDIEGESDSVSE